MPEGRRPDIAVCLSVTRAISGTRTLEEIYAAAIDALVQGLGVSRASILLFDPDGVMRFKAWRGLSAAYRKAVEGHTPWTRETPDPEPIMVTDVAQDVSLAPYMPIIRAEGIAAMGFIPLVSGGHVIGKFMIYFDAPYAPSLDEMRLALIIASQVAFAVERTRAEEEARRSEARLRFALDAVAMGTWEWNLATGRMQWSGNAERLHGLPAASFDGTTDGYLRWVHEDDRPRLEDAVRRVFEGATLPDLEYRVVAPGGGERWIEVKGRVECEDGRPVRVMGVTVEVTRRKQAEIARLEAAHESSRLKDEFLATLSHELRTPLNAVIGWLQMLQTGILTPDRASRAVEVISRNASHQARLIEDMLDVSRIVTGKLEIERTAVALEQVIEHAVDSVRPDARTKGVDLSIEIGELPPVSGDPRRLQQVFGNLLSNAVKFSRPGGRISLSGAAAQEGIAVSITDAGEGIAPEFLPHVFDRFRQADSRSTRRHGGLGLGLAIARHLVEQHGGTVTAESAGPGLGSTFTVRLPAASAPAPPHEDAPQAGAAAASELLHRVRVLVVDDDDDARHLLVDLLLHHGADTQAANSAEAALHVLEHTPVDVVVADIAMPGMDGYELASRIRRRHPRVPVLALSAYARPEDRARAADVGFDAYVTKPFEVTTLVSVILGLQRTGGGDSHGLASTAPGRRAPSARAL